MTPRAMTIGAAAIGLLLVPATWGRARDAVSTLHRGREATAMVSAEVAARPAPAVPLLASGRAIGKDAGAAERALADRLRLAAAHSGVLVERLAPAERNAPAVSVAIVATGAEAAVLAFARTIEAGEPLIRFSAWRLESGDGSAPIRLEARAVALAI